MKSHMHGLGLFILGLKLRCRGPVGFFEEAGHNMKLIILGTLHFRWIHDFRFDTRKKENS